ncbi:ABC transporter ATP-binding protein [Oceanobacillus sp. FSL K6-2867]|uniref:ABC transporter ATP-binding protein n=1 Tax=Oceanobacillus sp. FSL K6-2867 TaxID=2954748 RepID=UPI0030DB87CE
MLSVQSIAKSYGKKQILNQISFSVLPGEIIGLVGENGAGKSTLLNIMATLASPTSGNIFLYDKPYREKRKEVRKQIGYVPQDIAIWEDFSVEENMVFFEKLSWNSKTKQELRQLCLDMELDKWKEPVKTLSGGMKRKLNMAISLIHDPDLLLLDEPTVGIDLKSKKEIGNHLKNLAIKENKMVMYTSHDMDEISTLCDRIICIGEDPFYKNLLEEANKQIVTF